MISVRYHIVSIVAVFLAIGLGILLGSTVLDAAFVSRLESDIERARALRDEARDQLAETRESLREMERQFDAVAGLTLGERLEGRQVIYAVAGQEEPWHEVLRTAMVQAGAVTAATLRFIDRWGEEEAETELREVIEELVPDADVGEDAVTAVLARLGEELADSSGLALVEELEGLGYLSVEDRDEEGSWSGATAAMVVMAPGNGAGFLEPDALSSYLSGAAGVMPSLLAVAGDGAESVVAELRALDDRASFSSFLGADSDRTGVGSVLALQAAIEGRGGDFGTGPLVFIAAP